jgi:hypothetical protein
MFSTVKTGCPAQQIGREYSLPNSALIKEPGKAAAMKCLSESSALFLMVLGITSFARALLAMPAD